MIEVRSPLQIEAAPNGGWQLTFWVLDAFNYDTPFRAMLRKIADALGRSPDTDLLLPVAETGEDFVEGTLQIEGGELGVYFEHSLSYLMLTSDDVAALREAMECVRPHLRII